MDETEHNVEQKNSIDDTDRGDHFLNLITVTRTSLGYVKGEKTLVDLKIISYASFNCNNDSSWGVQFIHHIRFNHCALSWCGCLPTFFSLPFTCAAVAFFPIISCISSHCKYLMFIGGKGTHPFVFYCYIVDSDQRKH